jgi:hypothetical protein
MTTKKATVLLLLTSSSIAECVNGLTLSVHLSVCMRQETTQEMNTLFNETSAFIQISARME